MTFARRRNRQRRISQNVSSSSDAYLYTDLTTCSNTPDQNYKTNVRGKKCLSSHLGIKPHVPSLLILH